MLNERLSAAKRIADELIPAEQDVESAILRTTALIKAIVEGRRSAKVAITMGQESLVASAAALSGMIDARGQIGRAHEALAQDRIHAGLRAFGMGDVSECPDRPKALHVVGNQQSVAA